MSDKMIYKKFYFENYKGIKEVLEFPIDMNDNKPRCIIGKNEGGKTTILKGIKFISQLCNGKLFDEKDDIDKLCKDIEKMNQKLHSIHKKDLYFTGEVKVGAVLEFLKDDVEERISENLKTSLKNDINTIDVFYIFSFVDMEYKQTSINIKFNDTTIKVEYTFDNNGKCNKTIKVNETETKNDLHKDIFKLIEEYAQDILYYDDFMFSVPNVVRFSPKNEPKNDPDNFFNSKLNRDWQKIFDDILTCSSHDTNDANYKIRSFQDDVVDANLDEGIKSGRAKRMGTYLMNILNDWIKDNINSDIKDIEFLKVFNKNGFIDYKIQIKSKKDTPYDMSERSKGLQWTFCFNILTSIRKERHNNGFIFLLDEPASNLHILLQSKMLEEMNKMCKNKNLIIYSTHAPDLIDLENINNWWFVDNNAKELEETNISISQTPTNYNVVMPIIAQISYRSVIDIEKKNITIYQNVVSKIKDWFTDVASLDKAEKITAIAMI